MAKRHPARRRAPPEHANDPDDLFVAKMVEFSTWAKKNSQTLTLFGVALVIILAGVVYTVNFRATMQEQSVEQLEAIQQTVALGDPQTARAELAQFLERFASSPMAGEARLLLAELHLQDGQPTSAISVLEDAGISMREPVGVQIQVLLAKSYETAGQLDVAERLFVEVADRARLDFQRRGAMDNAARLRMALGNPGGASELYQQILDGMELTDPDRGFYEMRLAEAQARQRS